LKYILSFIFIFFTMYITGCSKNNKTAETVTKNETNTTQTQVKKEKTAEDVTVINFEGFQLVFKKNQLVYPQEREILLFDSNNSYSKAQELVLKKLNVKYYKTDSPYLKNYFHIQYYPTIVVLDKNKTVKYENFTPYEILKAEGF